MTFLNWLAVLGLACLTLWLIGAGCGLVRYLYQDTDRRQP